MADKKTTKKEYFQLMIDMYKEDSTPDDDLKVELIDFLNSQIESLDKEAARSKAYKAKKRKESETLDEEVKGTLTKDLSTVDDVVRLLAEKGIECSRQKVIARLSSLIKQEEVVKEAVKIDGGSKLMMYRLA